PLPLREGSRLASSLPLQALDLRTLLRHQRLQHTDPLHQHADVLDQLFSAELFKRGGRSAHGGRTRRTLRATYSRSGSTPPLGSTLGANQLLEIQPAWNVVVVRRSCCVLLLHGVKYGIPGCHLERVKRGIEGLAYRHV